MEIHGAHRLNGIVIVNEEEVEVDQEIDEAGRGNNYENGNVICSSCFQKYFNYIFILYFLLLCFQFQGHEIAEEVEDQHRVIGIEIEIVAKIRKKNANVNVRDCRRLKRNT